jgi:zinc transporter ZupT
MELDLIWARVKAFGIQLLGIFVTALIGFLGTFLGSDVFVNLVNEHFGGTVAAAIIFMVVQHVMAHMQNLQTIKMFGSNSDAVRRMLV